MLHSCIPPAHIRQACHGGYLRLHPRDPADIRSVVLHREFHVGRKHRTNVGRDMGVSGHFVGEGT